MDFKILNISFIVIFIGFTMLLVKCDSPNTKLNVELVFVRYFPEDLGVYDLKNTYNCTIILSNTDDKHKTIFTKDFFLNEEKYRPLNNRVLQIAPNTSVQHDLIFSANKLKTKNSYDNVEIEVYFKGFKEKIKESQDFSFCKMCLEQNCDQARPKRLFLIKEL